MLSRPCAGADGYSAAVGGFAALRMRHAPCGYIGPCRHDRFCVRNSRRDVGIAPYAELEAVCAFRNIPNYYLTTGTVGSACRDAVQTRPLFLLEIIYAVQKT